MEILKLKLYSKNLEEQFQFYIEHLGFALKSEEKDSFQITAGKTELIFQRSEKLQPSYHFAFLLPHSQIDDAVQFVKSKGVDILPYKGSDTIDFGNGRSVYFHDSDMNIVEFIQRPSLGFKSETSFSIDQVIKINEIGLPVENTLDMSQQLIDQYAVKLIDPNHLTEVFCWIGDFNGAFIVTKTGRNWLPTSIPAGINDFCIEFMARSNSIHSICIDKNKLSNWNLKT